jgi:hypothetical protein
LKHGMLSLTAFTAALAMAVLVATAGCGSRGPAQGAEDLELYAAAQDYVRDAASFRLTGSSDMSVTMGAGPSGAPQTVRMPMVEEVEQAGSLRIKASIDTTEMLKAMGLGEGGGGVAVTYLVDERLYLEIDGDWYYKDYVSTVAGMGLGNEQMITPEGIVQTMAAAESVEMVDETDAWAKFHGVLSEDFFGPIVEGLKESLASSSGEQLAALFSAFTGELDVIVDKVSGAVVRFERITRGSDIDLGQGTTMTLETRESFEISDYGVVFDIRLPEGARGAQPVEGSQVERRD